MQGEHDIIDLSRPIHTNMPVFPAIPKTFLGVYKGHQEGLHPPNFSAQTNILVTSDHAGTHIDAPLHFNPEGTGIDQFPVDLLIGPAVMQDFSFKKSGDSVRLEEVKRKLDGIKVNPKELKYVLFRTGAAELFYTDQYLSHYLEIHVDAVAWLADHGVLIFGVDANTVDHAKDRLTHLLMKKRRCYHIENLVNLEKLPQDRPFTFICNPLILKGSSGSPFRAFAVVNRE
jgi:kynurenine formamidase